MLLPLISVPSFATQMSARKRFAIRANRPSFSLQKIFPIDSSIRSAPERYWAARTSSPKASESRAAARRPAITAATV